MALMNDVLTKTVIDLGGAWRCAQAGTDDTMPAQVPGCVHLDLLAAQKIDDPFYRDNEDRLQWIGETDWIYTRTFDVSAALLAREQILLRCEGLDTLATITLNGQQVAQTDNMFRTWEFDVKPLLRAGENTLEIRFASTIPYIKQRQSERNVPSWGGPKEVSGRAWVRKEPCNYGWDWGPALVTCGIWRPITLVAYDTARLVDMHIQQDHTTPGEVTLTMAVSIQAPKTPDIQIKTSVSFDGQVVCESFERTTLVVKDPQLWWPNNLGGQPLYEVRVDLMRDGVVIDTLTRRIGLRTLQLDRHPDQWGESFQFVVNGVPFFAKGANWIPADTFVTRLTRESYADLLQSAKDANMTMLRLWGGGIYEHDDFYELCDEMGLCIWHDFIFGCSTYPTFDDDFMRSVKAEFEDNIRRVRHHPCIAMWCGNNELEQGLVGDAWNDHQMSWEDYSKLFDTLLPSVVHELDPERDYWPCSPHTPIGDRKDFNNPDCGDAHLWSVWHGRLPFEWYRTCTHRFNSEFGFQSFPEPKTVYGYTEPQDRNVTTYVMEHHQRSGIGNTVIMQYMLDWYRLPTSFEHTLWMSQILQGMAMKYAVEHWRRAMPRGMGTLYWQLNDCWPVASWASIDYHGRWKALQYMAKKFNAPLLVSGVEDLAKGTVEIHVTNDYRDARAATVRWTLTDLAGTVVAEGNRAITAAALANTLVETVDVSKELAQYGNRNLLCWLALDAGTDSSTNLIHFARPKHLELLPPQIDATVRDAADGTFVVTLQAHAPALWVWLELTDADARWSDNFLHLMAGQPVDITVKPATPMTAAELQTQLKVSSLVDTYAVEAVQV